MSLLILLLVGCKSVPEVASAPPVTLCEQTWPQFRAQMPPFLEFVELAEDMAQVVVATINRVEPPTNYSPDRVFIVGKESLPQTIVAFVENDCVVFAMPVPNRLLVLLMQGLIPGKQRGA